MVQKINDLVQILKKNLKCAVYAYKKFNNPCVVKKVIYFAKHA